MRCTVRFAVIRLMNTSGVVEIAVFAFAANAELAGDKEVGSRHLVGSTDWLMGKG